MLSIVNQKRSKAFHAVFDLPAERLFASLSLACPGTYYYLVNMKENVAVWSAGAVRDLNLPSPYLDPASRLWEERIHPEDRDAFRAGLASVRTRRSSVFSCEFRLRDGRDRYFWVSCCGHMDYDPDGEPSFLAGSISRMGVPVRIDATTSLWTVREFQADVGRMLRNHQEGTALLISIDNFKAVNDQYSYAFGDLILRELGNLLVRTAGTDSVVYRMDGADFGLLVHTCDHERIDALCRRINASLDTLEACGIRIRLGLRLTATCFPQDGRVYDQILNNLYYALYDAKHSRRHDVVFYTRELYLARNRASRLEAALKESVRCGFQGFSLAWQPIIDDSRHACDSTEVLLRWSSPEFPGIGPAEFVPVLEETGDIIPVGRWIIHEAVQRFASWHRRMKTGDRLPHININFSARQLDDPETIPYVLAELDRAELPHECLVLELTESCRASSSLPAVLEAVHREGIRIALDDLGTGYSSLLVLKEIPADIVKIDHQMVSTISKSRKDLALIEMISEYCAKVGICVCAEGVENEQVAALIRSAGIPLIQGYYFDRPMKENDFVGKYLS